MENYVFITGELLEKGMLDKLGMDCRVICDYSISGYKEKALQSGKTYLSLSAEDKVKGRVITMDARQLWKLDQWKEAPVLERKLIPVSLKGTQVNLYFYTSYDDRYGSEILNKYDYKKITGEHIGLISQNQLPYSDLHLMIPCAIIASPEILDNGTSNIAEWLMNNIAESNRQEFKGSFVKMLDRVYLGKYYFSYTYEGSEYRQPCFITLAQHVKTQAAVLDIVIPAVAAPAHFIMANFCYQNFSLYDGDDLYPINNWLLSRGLEIYGTVRNVVFSYEQITEEALLNALVSEAVPMGKIMGRTFVDAMTDNIAQYDTAKVHVSENTLLEITGKFDADIYTRFACQAIELFFIELLLLQDAAISRVCSHIQEQIEAESIRGKPSADMLDALIYESSQAIMFWDIDQFYFPTVRLSARNIAERFGMHRQMDKYYQNIGILEKLIDIHESKIEAAENKVLNGLLILLTLVQVFPSFVDITRQIIAGTLTLDSVIAFVISCITAATILVIYAVVKKQSIRKQVRIRKQMRESLNDRKNGIQKRSR